MGRKSTNTFGRKTLRFLNEAKTNPTQNNIRKAVQAAFNAVGKLGIVAPPQTDEDPRPGYSYFREIRIKTLFNFIGGNNMHAVGLATVMEELECLLEHYEQLSPQPKYADLNRPHDTRQSSLSCNKWRL